MKFEERRKLEINEK